MENKYRLVRRTKRNSLVTIESDNNMASIDITNCEDMLNLVYILNTSRIRFNLSQPTKLVGKGWRVEFNFSDLEKFMAYRKEGNWLLLC